jgi:hypothetical protein
VRVTVVRPGDLGPSEASLWARFQKSFIYEGATFDAKRVMRKARLRGSRYRIRPDLSGATDAYYLEKVARRDAG